MIMSIRKIAIVDKVNGRIDVTNYGAGTAGQSVSFDNTAE